MKSYRDYLNESSENIMNLKKGKWSQFDPKDLTDEEKAELSPEFLELINTAYAPIGGHVNYKKKEDIFKKAKINVWKGVDLHGSPDVDLITFGAKTKYGIKWVGVGHDGESDSKKGYIAKKAEDINKTGGYSELSGGISQIMIVKFGVPTVNNKEDVEKVLGKEIRWVGKHPDADKPGREGIKGDGWYERELGGKKHLKILVGKPKGVKTDSI